jgi:prevent-host-death family protein
METMRIIGVDELKEQAGELIRQVRDQGRAIEISDGGAVVARLVPVHAVTNVIKDDEVIWADLERLSEEISARWQGSLSAVDAVRDVRD